MLRITTTPPAHSVDDVPTWIWQGDPAWDVERITKEKTALADRADEHPVVRYLNGETRYALEAEITVPDAIRGDGPATARVESWLMPKASPTRFELRSVGGRDWATAERVTDEVGFYEFARRGLVRICDAVGADGQPSDIVPPRGPDGAIREPFFDDMSREHRALLGELGVAVYMLSKNEVSRAEGKP
jgi:hypothetical protein